MTDIKTIREAMHRMHDYATKPTAPAYMSIPADPKRDADLILSAAIDELETLRALAKETSLFLSEARTQGAMTLKTTEQWDRLEVLHNRLAAASKS